MEWTRIAATEYHSPIGSVVGTSAWWSWFFYPSEEIVTPRYDGEVAFAGPYKTAQDAMDDAERRCRPQGITPPPQVQT